MHSERQALLFNRYIYIRIYVYTYIDINMHIYIYMLYEFYIYIYIYIYDVGYSKNRTQFVDVGNAGQEGGIKHVRKP